MSNQLYKIILIDDDPIVNFYNEDLLSNMNISTEILVFERAEEALKYLKQESVQQEQVKSLIFLDINMPGMNGFEFLEIYKELKKNNKVDAVICMLTTSLNANDKERVASLNIVSSYISKPLDEEKVFEVINSLNGKEDLVVFDERKLGGMPDERRIKLLKLYTDLLKETLEIINLAKEENDVATVQFQSHKLKGSSCAVGAMQLEVIFSRMEDHIIHNQDLTVNDLFKELNEAVTLFFKEVDDI